MNEERRNPPMPEQAHRVKGYAGLQEHQGEICYWKTDEGIWMLYLPLCGLGNLSNHTVTENADGTITVQPSILVTGHNGGAKIQRHGYITNGEWMDA